MISSCFLRFLPFFSRYRRHCHVTWRNQPLTFHFRLANCPLAYVVKRSSRLCGWILRTFQTRSSLLMLTLFKSIVLSRIDYGSQLWSPSKKGYLLFFRANQGTEISVHRNANSATNFAGKHEMFSKLVGSSSESKRTGPDVPSNQEQSVPKQPNSQFNLLELHSKQRNNTNVLNSCYNVVYLNIAGQWQK